MITSSLNKLFFLFPRPNSKFIIQNLPLAKYIKNTQQKKVLNLFEWPPLRSSSTVSNVRNTLHNKHVVTRKAPFNKFHLNGTA